MIVIYSGFRFRRDKRDILDQSAGYLRLFYSKRGVNTSCQISAIAV